MTDGQRIRLAGQGGQGTAQAPAGDLYLVVRIAPHPRYRVEGRDIYVELPLAPWEAALGATVRRRDSRPARPRSRCRPARRAGGGCACADGACRTRAANPATSTPRSGSWCPPSLSDEERRLFEELAETSTFDPRKTR